MRWLLLAFLIVPALEIGIFVWAGGIIGPWWVVAIILLTGLIGIMLARYQGMETLARAQRSMNKGQAPTSEIIDGIAIFVGAVFLFAPGFLTDFIGLLLVFPWTRVIFKTSIIGLLRRFINKGKGTIIYRKW